MKRIEETIEYCSVCGKSVNIKNIGDALPIGTIIDNRYYIGAVIGEGDFGFTYVGCDTRLNKKVAIKEYFPCKYVYRLSENSTILSASTGEDYAIFEHGKKLFLEQALLLAKLSDNRNVNRDYNVVSVTDIVRENNTAYIIMQYVSGQTLQVFLKNNGLMKADDAFSMIEPIINVLGDSRAKDLIHGDISSTNIIIQPDGNPVLINFGLGKGLLRSTNDIRFIFLKPEYLLSERILDKKADVYAICSVLYEMITGIVPPNDYDRTFGDELKKPSDLGASIENAQEKVLLKGLSTNQEDRFSSILDLKNAFPEFSPSNSITNDNAPARNQFQFAFVAALIVSLCVVLTSLLLLKPYPKSTPGVKVVNIHNGEMATLNKSEIVDMLQGNIGVYPKASYIVKNDSFIMGLENAEGKLIQTDELLYNCAGEGIIEIGNDTDYSNICTVKAKAPGNVEIILTDKTTLGKKSIKICDSNDFTHPELINAYGDLLSKGLLSNKQIELQKGHIGLIEIDILKLYKLLKCDDLIDEYNRKGSLTYSCYVDDYLIPKVSLTPSGKMAVRVDYNETCKQNCNIVILLMNPESTKINARISIPVNKKNEESIINSKSEVSLIINNNPLDDSIDQKVFRGSDDKPVVHIISEHPRTIDIQYFYYSDIGKGSEDEYGVELQAEKQLTRRILRNTLKPWKQQYVYISIRDHITGEELAGKAIAVCESLNSIPTEKVLSMSLEEFLEYAGK